MTREDLVRKIQKLFALGESPNPNEAANALSKAHALMAKYNISAEDLGEDEKSITEIEMNESTKTVSKYRLDLASALGKHFGCRVLLKRSSLGKQRMLFVGDSVKVKVFRECYEFAYNSFIQAFKEYFKDFNSSSKQESNQVKWSYFCGFCRGITNEITLNENKFGLVVVESTELKDYISNLHVRYTHPTRQAIQDDLAMNTGYKDGSFAFRNKNKGIYGN